MLTTIPFMNGSKQQNKNSLTVSKGAFFKKNKKRKENKFFKIETSSITFYVKTKWKNEIEGLKLKLSTRSCVR